MLSLVPAKSSSDRGWQPTHKTWPLVLISTIPLQSDSDGNEGDLVGSMVNPSSIWESVLSLFNVRVGSYAFSAI